MDQSEQQHQLHLIQNQNLNHLDQRSAFKGQSDDLMTMIYDASMKTTR